MRRLLCEVHEEYSTNIALALHGYWVYDFSLPLLILHAFTFKTMDNLRHWLGICPRRQITVLDTHDGMGIDDIAGLAEVGTFSNFNLNIPIFESLKLLNSNVWNFCSFDLVARLLLWQIYGYERIVW